jgi:hypothetical protein
MFSVLSCLVIITFKMWDWVVVIQMCLVAEYTDDTQDAKGGEVK